MMTLPSTWRAARPMVWIKCRLRTQEAGFVRIEDRHQRDLRQIQTFAQKIDSDNNIVNPHAQVAQDFHPFQRIDLGM